MGIWARRLASLFSFRRIWGPALTVLGLVGQALHWGWQSLDILGRLDVFWRVVETMGGSTAMVASIISSWQFSLALIVVGIGYTVFVGEPESGTQRHAWWPYVAASVFFVCVATMGTVAIYGAMELYIREQIAKGVAGVPRDTPDVSSPTRPQAPLFTNSTVYDGLTPDQTRILIVEMSKLKPILPVVYFSHPPNNNTVFGFWSQMDDILNRSGMSSNGWPGLPERPRGPEEEGLMIAVRDLSNMPETAQRFREALEVANIHMRLIEMPKGMVGDSVEFVVFIGPRPINR